MTATMSDLVEQAARRARLAALLGRLLLAEPGPDAADLVRGIDELEPLGRADAELSAEYERLVLREVPLFESVFLGTDGQRGGPIVAEVLDWYRRYDFDEGDAWRVPSADHLGVELRFLGHLIAREAGAWDADRPDDAARFVEAQREFLAAHLGQWGEVAVAAVARRAGASPYAALACAVGELLVSEAERLRTAPHHDGMPPVATEEPPRNLGPARLARWFLAPARAGVFLDVDDLADASLSIGVPWRPSDPRSAFRHVVESAVDGGDLDRLLLSLRPTVCAARDAAACNEHERDGDRRVWTRWRLQAEHTLELIDRLAGGGLDRGDESGRVTVSVRGPGHHERTRAAAAVVRAVAPIATVAVSADLRPRLADDVAALIDAGATEVLLAGASVSAVAMRDGGNDADREQRHLVDANVVVRLVPAAGPVSVEVHERSHLADLVRRALDLCR